MKSKHCPCKNHCHSAGDCQNCAHGQTYERMANKIGRLAQEKRRMRDQLAAMRGTERCKKS